MFLFLAARYLPDEDKVKLVDVVHGIENYVETFNTSKKSDEVGMHVGTLLKRLPNLRKLDMETWNWTDDYTYDEDVVLYLLRIVILYSLFYSQPIGCAVGYLYLVVQSASWTVFKLGFS